LHDLIFNRKKGIHSNPQIFYRLLCNVRPPVYSYVVKLAQQTADLHNPLRTASNKKLLQIHRSYRSFQFQTLLGKKLFAGIESRPIWAHLRLVSFPLTASFILISKMRIGLRSRLAQVELPPCQIQVKKGLNWLLWVLVHPPKLNSQTARDPTGSFRRRSISKNKSRRMNKNGATLFG